MATRRVKTLKEQSLISADILEDPISISAVILQVWQIFKNAPFFTSISSDFYSQETPPNFHGFESFSVIVCSEFRKKVPLETAFPQRTSILTTSLDKSIIYPPYPQILHYRVIFLSFISYTSFVNIISTVFLSFERLLSTVLGEI